MPVDETLNLSNVEKRLIYELGGDIGPSPSPFAELGRRVGLSEEQVIEIMRSLRERGILRRFGATLRHQLSGFTANAMAAWRVDPDRIEEVGEIMASFPEVTHCYQRRTMPDWTKNLYTMIHASSEQECRRLAERMAEAAGVSDYELLFSEEELKKTSMRYFHE